MMLVTEKMENSGSIDYPFERDCNAVPPSIMATGQLDSDDS